MGVSITWSGVSFELVDEFLPNSDTMNTNNTKPQAAMKIKTIITTRMLISLDPSPEVTGAASGWLASAPGVISERT